MALLASVPPKLKKITKNDIYQMEKNSVKLKKVNIQSNRRIKIKIF